MAFIWKDAKSSSWYLDYTPPVGKRVRKRVGKSKQAAQLALKEVEYQFSFDRAGVSTPDITLKDFFAKYEETIQPKLRSKSWTRYRAIILKTAVAGSPTAVRGSKIRSSEGHAAVPRMYSPKTSAR